MAFSVALCNTIQLSYVNYDVRCDIIHDSITFLFLRYLKPDVQKKSKHKTAVIKKTLNPEFNEVVSMCVYVTVSMRCTIVTAHSDL